MCGASPWPKCDGAHKTYALKEFVFLIEVKTGLVSCGLAGRFGGESNKANIADSYWLKQSGLLSCSRFKGQTRRAVVFLWFHPSPLNRCLAGQSAVLPEGRN
jgi:hypothetical protein